MRNITIQATQKEDLENFQMIGADAQEVFLASSQKRFPFEALKRAVDLSRESWSIFQDGELVGIFGHGPQTDNPDHGCVWFLRTDAFRKMTKRDVLVLSKHCLGWMTPHYKRIENMTFHRSSLKWLEGLGFTIGDQVWVSQPHGYTAFFTHFYMEVHNV